MAQAACGGVRNGARYNIAGDGLCMYNSVLTSLRLHPCGDLIAIRGLPASVPALIQAILAHPSWEAYWRLLYEPIRGRSVKDVGDPLWAFTFLRDKSKTVEQYLAEARRIVGNPGGSTDSWGGDGEYTAIKNILRAANITLNRFNTSSPLTANFGTLANPNIYVIYSGAHYDSYTHTQAATPATTATAATAATPAVPRAALPRALPRAALPAAATAATAAVPTARVTVARNPPPTATVNLSLVNVGRQREILKNIENRKKAKKPQATNWTCGMCSTKNPANLARCKECDFDKMGGGAKKTRRKSKKQLKRKTKKRA